MWLGTISGPRIDPGHSSFKSLEGRGGTSKEDRGTAASKVGGKSRNGKPWKPGEESISRCDASAMSNAAYR